MQVQYRSNSETGKWVDVTPPSSGWGYNVALAPATWQPEPAAPQDRG